MALDVKYDVIHSVKKVLEENKLITVTRISIVVL
jgi:hypothetical protein